MYDVFKGHWGGNPPPPSLYCFKGGWDAEQELYPLKAGELLILTPVFSLGSAE